VAVGDFNGDSFPDLAVAAGESVTVLLNAANRGGGHAAAPPRRPAHHRPAPSQARMEPVAALLAASNPQAEHPLSLTFVDLPPSPVRQWPLRTETVQLGDPEAGLTPRPMLTARHAQDAVFERWGYAIVDALAMDLLR